jgi:hypothetical protein
VAATTARGIRPDAWDIALLLHVFGAMLLVGALVLAASALFVARRGTAQGAGSVSLLRLGYRTLLLGVLPGWLLMRIGAEWIADKEGLTDAKLTWLDLGYTTADGGLLAILIATVLAGVGARRARREAGPGRLGPAAAALASLLVIAYLVVVWAMTAKPA